MCTPIRRSRSNGCSRCWRKGIDEDAIDERLVRSRPVRHGDAGGTDTGATTTGAAAGRRCRARRARNTATAAATTARGDAGPGETDRVGHGTLAGSTRRPEARTLGRGAGGLEHAARLDDAAGRE